MLSRVLFILSVVVCTDANALQSSQATPSHPVLASVEQCILDAITCRTITRELQKIQTPRSTEWFRTTYLLMNALWESERLSIPMEEMRTYATMQNSPPVFAATAYTIYAKQLLRAGEREAGRHYADKAMELLLNMPQSALTPRRYSEAIILLQYLKDYEKAQVLIDKAMDRYADIGRGFVKASLLTAAGHNAFHQKKWKEATEWYQRAVDAHQTENNNTGLAIAHFNVGRSYQMAGSFDKAEAAMKKALEIHDLTDTDELLRDKYYWQTRLCQVLLALKKTKEAKTLFSSLKRERMHSYHHRHYDAVESELAGR